MIDLETLGAGQVNVPVIGIGAVFFDPDSGELGAEFDAAISMEGAVNFAKPTGGTIKWWMQQSDAARKVAIRGEEDPRAAFERLYKFCCGGSGIWKNQVWGNGSSFDISILEYAFPRIIGKDAPWKFWNVRDCRTMKELCEGRFQLGDKFEGTAHVALDDAKHQAKWVSRGWQFLRDGVLENISPPKVSGSLLDI